MKTFTLEFKALIIIFLSTGPVISSLLSSKSSGMSLTFHTESRISLVSGSNPGKIPESTKD
tara:strand:- start:12180 stop:12362 length:183 start_codon:yes stop_codon:yes gene_type:complete